MFKQKINEILTFIIRHCATSKKQIVQVMIPNSNIFVDVGNHSLTNLTSFESDPAETAGRVDLDDLDGTGPLAKKAKFLARLLFRLQPNCLKQGLSPPTL